MFPGEISSVNQTGKEEKPHLKTVQATQVENKTTHHGPDVFMD